MDSPFVRRVAISLMPEDPVRAIQMVNFHW
jgi:hypothetical protein